VARVCFFLMKRTLVMTLLGPDRPGLVDAVAEAVAAHEGNWLESRLSRLGRQFAGIVRVEAPEERIAALTLALQRLPGAGLTVVVHPDENEPEPAPARRMVIDVIGHDRPGIVRQVAHALAVEGVNVEELNTSVISAPMSGEILFRARAEVRVPVGVDTERLRAALERIASDLMVDLSFSTAEG
jgi:glycine cleavage system regulatory protein